MVKENIVDFDMDQLDQFIANEDGRVRSQLLNQFDRQLIKHCLKQNKNNQTVVAEILGINRVTLRTRIRNLGIKVGL